MDKILKSTYLQTENEFVGKIDAECMRGLEVCWK